MAMQALVELLADGQFHSGEDIGRLFGVSRAAVWKRLQKLTEFGLYIDSVKGKGYRLVQPIELLRQSLIQQGFTDAAHKNIEVLEILFDVASTNQYALEQVSSGVYGKGALCMAEYQYQGRGRRGRQWVSPLGANLCVSLVWEFEGGAAALEGLSLVVGIAVARALMTLGVEGVGLKWPNDILFNGAKLGGILLEMVGDPAGRCQVVIGIGVNVFMHKMYERQADIGQPWVALLHISPNISRNVVASTIINELVSVLLSYGKTGFFPYVDEWRRYDIYYGRCVNVLMGDQQVVGVAQGVADNGALLLNVSGVERRFYGGELSLRSHEEA